MPDHPELTKLLANVPNIEVLIRQAFEAGKVVGDQIATERETNKVAKAFQSLGLHIQVAERPIEFQGPESPPLHAHLSDEQEAPSGSHVPEYGRIVNPVRVALRTLGCSAEGFGPQEVTTLVNQSPGGAGIDVGQVRTALKVLARRGEAFRLVRGRYLAIEHAVGLKPAPDEPEEVDEEHAREVASGEGSQEKGGKDDLRPITPLGASWSDRAE